MPAGKAVATLASMALPTRRPSQQPRTPDEGVVGDRYLTDGRRLFRVVSQFAPGTRAEAALLEDCVTLAVESYSPTELYEMGLRPVRGSAEGA